MAVRIKAGGERAIDTTVGHWNGGPSKAVVEYRSCYWLRRAYIVSGTGLPGAASRYRRLAVVMY